MIKGENICKGYDSLQVLDDLCIDVKGGQFCIITGPSGTGKSTLLNVLSRLDKADSGDLFLMGQRINGMKNRQLAMLRRKYIGFIFQSYNLISSKNSIENVALPLKYNKVKYFARRNMAMAALDRMGLADKYYNYPHQLSGGQQQRVAVARALVTRPRILFCDEPTGNLDSDSARLVMEGILSLRDSGSAIIMITHDKSLLQYADCAYILQDGKLAVDKK
ncbi:MAG: ABC transporter ATP-binding protein [Oscillospiraceae bacterium]|nr:ABC transporter ATP-binding protein [Oscillospiraceae bacterium]